MWPPMWAQHDPKNSEKHFRPNKVATLGANNIKTKGGRFVLMSDSWNMAKSKSEYQFSAFYLVRRLIYKLPKSENITNITFHDSRARKMAFSTKFQRAISEKRHGVWIFFFACVNISHSPLFWWSFIKIQEGDLGTFQKTGWFDTECFCHSVPIVGPQWK